MKRLKAPSKPSKAKPERKPQPEETGQSDCAYLNLGGDAILSVIHQATRKALDIYEHEKPDGAPVGQNADITNLSMRQVGQLHQYYTSMHAYAIQELARSDQDLTLAEYNHDVPKKQLMLSLDSGQQKYKIEAEMAQNEKIKRAWELVLEKRAYKEMLSALSRGLENKAAMASREISRRGAERNQS